jgi:PAS domain S-box-containing protein
MEQGLPAPQANQEKQAFLSTYIHDMRTCEERFALTVYGSNDGWWDRDLRTNTVYFSPRWKQMLGYRDDELPNHFEEWLKRVHPDDLERVVMSALRQQMDGYTETYEFDHRIQHKDGSYRWIRARGSALRDDCDTVYRIAGWHTDITDRKQEEDLQARRTQHAAFRVDVSMALTERASLPAVLQRCTEAMVHHLHAAFARIWTLSPGEEFLVLQASAGKYTHLNGSHARISLGTLKIGRIALERRPYLINDVPNDAQISDRAWARSEGMVSFAGYPLLVEDQVVGVMAMFSQEPLMEDTLDALATVAHAIAQGIGRKWAEEHLEERVNERTKELTLLLEMSRNIASTLELKPLLDTILTQLKTVVDYRAVVLYAMQDDRLTLLNYQGEQPREQIKWLLSLVEQDMTRALQHHQYDPLMIDDIAQDSRLTQIAAEAERIHPIMESTYLHCWMGVPLMVKERVIGFLALFHSRSYYYTQQHASLAHALAYQAAVALENAWLYGQAQELAVLLERQRLARELHDSVTQSLYGIVLGTRSARALLHRDPGKLDKLLDNVHAQAETGLTEMRTLIFELRPEILEIEGLVTALKKQVEAVQIRHELEIVTELGEEPRLSFLSKEALYRIAQEALHNVVKHANATAVKLQLSEDSSKGVAGMVLEVSDNGVGFHPQQSFPGHLGLQSMRERLARLGGTLEITSAPGEGTCIRASIP